jgi:hypothetical protein
VTCDEDVMNAIEGLEKFSPQNKAHNLQQQHSNKLPADEGFRRTDRRAITTSEESDQHDGDADDAAALSEDSSVVRRREYLADRHKTTKNRAHFSSSSGSDESDGERVRYFKAGVIQTRRVSVEEVQHQQSGAEEEDETCYYEGSGISTRQRRLRPRMVHHLNDASSSSSSSEGVDG